MPVNNRFNVAEALDAARYYADVTGRRLSIEYALIRDVNDQPWRADLLGKRLHGALGPLVHVNVIPLNPTPGSEWDAGPKAAEREFVKRVRGRGVLLHRARHPRPRNRRRLWPIGGRRLTCRPPETATALGSTTRCAHLAATMSRRFSRTAG